MWGREKKSEEPSEDRVPAGPTAATQADPVANSHDVEDGTVDRPAGIADDDTDPIRVRDRIIAVLKTVYDPEIPVDIYELGLVYGVEVTDDAEVHVTMTLTTPMCPVAETLPPEVEDKVRNVRGVKDVTLALVWDPAWSIEMMSDAARLELNLM